MENLGYIIDIDYRPPTSDQYFISLVNTFHSLIFEDVIPTIIVLAKIGAFIRVLRWSKIQLDFYKLHRYLNHIRGSIRTKKIKATIRAQLQDGDSLCPMCQANLDELNIAYGHVMEQTHEQFVNAMMAPSGMEQAVIATFSLAAQKINAYQLLIANYEVASVECDVLTSLENTIEALNRMIRAHIIIAFATNTIYLIFMMRI